jgi:hypothetical protein
MLRDSLAELDDEEILDGLSIKDKRVDSLRDLQYLYGHIYEKALKTNSGSYTTPSASEELIGEPDSVIAVKIDFDYLSDISKTNLDDISQSNYNINNLFKGVEVRTYNKSLVDKLSHSQSDGNRDVDHSVTHKTGERTVSKLSEDVFERFSRWASDDIVKDCIKSHKDNWIVKWMEILGEDSQFENQVKQQVQSKVSGKQKRLVSVLCKIDGEWKWPGDIDIFNDCTEYRMIEKLSEKGSGVEKSKGKSVGFVSGEEDSCVGTMSDPLSYYLVKQGEKFPNLNKDESWRIQPLSPETCVKIKNSEEFTEECYFTFNGLRVYMLPFFSGNITSEKIKRNYEILNYLSNSDGNPMYEIYKNYKEAGYEDLKFYFIVGVDTGLKMRVSFEEIVNFVELFDLPQEHKSILENYSYFGEDSLFGEHSDVNLLDTGNLVEDFSSFFYFILTMDNEGDDARINSPIVNIVEKTLRKEKVSPDFLIREFTRELEKTEREREEFPEILVKQQYIQLLSLANLGIVNNINQKFNLKTVMEEKEERIQQFIKETPMLEDTERRFAFLVGCMVGAVSNYQEYRRDLSTTMIDKYPISDMTNSKLKRAYADSLDRNIVYSSENDEVGMMMYKYYSEKIEETLSKLEGEVSLGNYDTKFFYSLGVTYSLNN